jgi:hypothetical protein
MMNTSRFQEKKNSDSLRISQKRTSRRFNKNLNQLISKENREKRIFKENRSKQKVSYNPPWGNKTMIENQRLFDMEDDIWWFDMENDHDCYDHYDGYWDYVNYDGGNHLSNVNNFYYDGRDGFNDESACDCGLC